MPETYPRFREKSQESLRRGLIRRVGARRAARASSTPSVGRPVRSEVDKAASGPAVELPGLYHTGSLFWGTLFSKSFKLYY
jgi:hypothetical protein